MDLGKNLRTFRKLKKITQNELAELANVSRSTYAGYEVNASLPPVDKLIIFSKILGVSVDELLKDEDEPSNSLNSVINNNPNIRVVPLVNTVRIGNSIYYDQDILGQEIVDLPTSDHDNYFLLVVRNDTLFNTRMKQGDVVLVHKTVNIENDDCIVMVGTSEEGPVIKRYKEYTDGSKWLITDNPNHPPIKLDNDVNDRLIGKVVQIRIKL